MSREIDRRDDQARTDAAPPRSARAPDLAAHHLVTRALQEARGSEGIVDFLPDPAVQRTGDAQVVHMRQYHLGIPVFEATQLVRFTGEDRVSAAVDRSVVPRAGTPAQPRLPAEQAVLWAAAHVATPRPDEAAGTDPLGGPLRPASVDVTGLRPEVLAAFTDRPDRPTVLAAGPFGAPIKAELVWFPLGGRLLLGWQVLLTMPGYQEQYRTVVDAHSGEIVYCRQLVQAVLGRGDVFGVGNPPARSWVPFPRPLTDYGLPHPPALPGAFPDPWIARDATQGNSVRAHADDAGPPVTGLVGGGGVVTFDPPEPSVEQDVLNGFFHACTMHDVLYLLGFTESSGNFQADTLGRGGIGNDPVDVRCFAGPIQLTASMASTVDGFGAVLRLGRVTSSGRHTARDATVVYHEYAHGLTNRLVGGPADEQSLERPQSAAMGEGWSDFIACTLTGVDVVGAWAFGRPGGIRRAPYDDQYPFDYGWLASAAGAGPHAPGEIWCAALMNLARRIGDVEALQLVVDALPLTPANPSFLDGRDALLAALDARLGAGGLTVAEHATRVGRLWQAFARFGMGPAAVSPGSGLGGVVADLAVPAPPPTVLVDA